MSESIEVGMGEVKIAQAPALLRTNLGSCVGVVLYDAVSRWGGLAHIVSPESAQELSKVSTCYADIAIPVLLDMLYERGCRKNNFICSIGGGGCMFGGASDILDIGKKNIESVKRILAQENINITREEVGGNYSTVILFDTADGNVDFNRQKATLNIVIKKEKDYQKKWIDQSAGALKQMEAYIMTKQAEFSDPETKIIIPEKLLAIIRLYSAMNKISRLVSYIVYTNITRRGQTSI